MIAYVHAYRWQTREEGDDGGASEKSAAAAISPLASRLTIARMAVKSSVLLLYMHAL